MSRPPPQPPKRSMWPFGSSSSPKPRVAPQTVSFHAPSAPVTLPILANNVGTPNSLPMSTDVLRQELIKKHLDTRSIASLATASRATNADGKHAKKEFDDQGKGKTLFDQWSAPLARSYRFNLLKSVWDTPVGHQLLGAGTVTLDDMGNFLAYSSSFFAQVTTIMPHPETYLALFYASAPLKPKLTWRIYADMYRYRMHDDRLENIRTLFLAILDESTVSAIAAGVIDEQELSLLLQMPDHDASFTYEGSILNNFIQTSKSVGYKDPTLAPYCGIAAFKKVFPDAITEATIAEIRDVGFNDEDHLGLARICAAAHTAFERAPETRVDFPQWVYSRAAQHAAAGASAASASVKRRVDSGYRTFGQGALPHAQPSSYAMHSGLGDSPGAMSDDLSAAQARVPGSIPMDRDSMRHTINAFLTASEISTLATTSHGSSAAVKNAHPRIIHDHIKGKALFDLHIRPLIGDPSNYTAESVRKVWDRPVGYRLLGSNIVDWRDLAACCANVQSPDGVDSFEHRLSSLLAPTNDNDAPRPILELFCRPGDATEKPLLTWSAIKALRRPGDRWRLFLNHVLSDNIMYLLIEKLITEDEIILLTNVSAREKYEFRSLLDVFDDSRRRPDNVLYAEWMTYRDYVGLSGFKYVFPGTITPDVAQAIRDVGIDRYGKGVSRACKEAYELNHRPSDVDFATWVRTRGAASASSPSSSSSSSSSSSLSGDSIRRTGFNYPTFGHGPLPHAQPASYAIHSGLGDSLDMPDAVMANILADFFDRQSSAVFATLSQASNRVAEISTNRAFQDEKRGRTLFDMLRSNVAVMDVDDEASHAAWVRDLWDTPYGHRLLGSRTVNLVDLFRSYCHLVDPSVEPYTFSVFVTRQLHWPDRRRYLQLFCRPVDKNAKAKLTWATYVDIVEQPDAPSIESLFDPHILDLVAAGTIVESELLLLWETMRPGATPHTLLDGFLRATQRGREMNRIPGQQAPLYNFTSLGDFKRVFPEQITMQTILALESMPYTSDLQNGLDVARECQVAARVFQVEATCVDFSTWIMLRQMKLTSAAFRSMLSSRGAAAAAAAQPPSMEAALPLLLLPLPPAKHGIMGGIAVEMEPGAAVVGPQRLQSTATLEFKAKVDMQTSRLEVGSDTVYFTLEKVTRSNLDFWKEFRQDQTYHTQRCGAQIPDQDAYTTPSGVAVPRKKSKTVPVVDGTNSFQTSLDVFEQSSPSDAEPFDLWIAYAASSPTIADNVRDTRGSVSRFEPIEMVVTVFLSAKSPITTHMGIFRTYHYYGMEPGKRMHTSLSIHLHSFAAKTSLTIYPYTRKQCMVTNPADEMRHIMVRAMKKRAALRQLPFERVLTVGDEQQRLRLQRQIDNVEHDRQLLAADPHATLDQFKSFNDFKRGYITRNVGQTRRAPFGLSDEEYDAFVATPYTLAELVAQHLASEREHLAYRLAHDEWCPSNPNDPSFFDPKPDATAWTLLRGKDTIVFAKPPWFRHRDLLNHLATMAVDLDLLSSREGYRPPRTPPSR